MFRKWFGKEPSGKEPPCYSAVGSVPTEMLVENREKLRKEIQTQGDGLTRLWSLFWQTPGAEQLPVASSIRHFPCTLHHYDHPSQTCSRSEVVWFWSGGKICLTIDGTGGIVVKFTHTVCDVNGAHTIGADWAGSSPEVAVAVVLRYING